MADQIKILVVEDEQRMRDLLSLYLVREGYKVVEAGDGQAALAKFSREEFSLVLLDVMLPGLDGWAVCQQIRQKSDVPIIMLTARGEEIDRVTGFELGVDDYVVKPFSPRELIMRIKALLKRTCPLIAKREGELKFPGLTINHPSRRVEAVAQKWPRPKSMTCYIFSPAKGACVYPRATAGAGLGYDFYGILELSIPISKTCAINSIKPVKELNIGYCLGCGLQV